MKRAAKPFSYLIELITFVSILYNYIICLYEAIDLSMWNLRGGNADGIHKETGD